MANEKNLRRLTSEQAREIGRKGGLASAESKRRTKTLKQGLERLLLAPVKDATDRKKLAAMGIPVDDMTHEELVSLALVRKAMDGDVKAFEVIRSVLGEDTRLPPGADAEFDGLFEALAKKVAQVDI